MIFRDSKKKKKQKIHELFVEFMIIFIKTFVVLQFQFVFCLKEDQFC